MRNHEPPRILSRSSSVAHLTSVHGASDVRIFHKECRSLARAGYTTTLIVASQDPVELEPNLEIVRVPRVGNRLGRIMRTSWVVYRAAIRTSAEIYHLHDPELLPLAFILRLRGKQVIYDAHEDLPSQVLSKHYIPRLLRKPISWVARAMLWAAGHVCSRVVAATPGVAARFPKRKTIIVQNFPLLSEFAAAPDTSLRRPNMIYVGGLSLSRGAVQMVEAMSYVRTTGASLTLAGSFVPSNLEEDLKLLPEWSKVNFAGWQTRDDIASLLSQSSVGLATLHPTAGHLESYPVKLFEYMAAGLPVVASDFPLWRQIVECDGCGILVDPLDAKAIATAVDYILSHPHEARAMGARGRNAIVEKYNWDIEAAKLLRLYAEIFRQLADAEASQ